MYITLPLKFYKEAISATFRSQHSLNHNREKKKSQFSNLEFHTNREEPQIYYFEIFTHQRIEEHFN
uniref:Uncharacterized protein n=1 Tax=Rhizophora mucronata TaxID=61149 RepID=A0A2P2Q052_RHIMU